MIHDAAIVGGGIVGLAAARQLLRERPGLSLLLLEKEPALALHQTGRNSGVIHAGVYYAPGSLKARLCREGAQATRDFCAMHGVPVLSCGKLIVATEAGELGRLAALAARARQNGIDCEDVDAARLRELEPRIRGIAGLRVPASAVVDYTAVAAALAADLRAAGAELRLGAGLLALHEDGRGVTLGTSAGEFRARTLLACAGLQSDRVARLAGLRPDFRILPFRGEYFRLAPRLDRVASHMIYPVPDPALPFLGVHLTRTADGGVSVGPNAVAGLAREGYARGSVDLRDLRELLGFPGSWRYARRHLRHGLRELRDSLWRRGYLAAVRRYCPEVELQDLLPHPTGIRAQAVRRDGTPVEDFLFLETARTLHVCNAPSPAATSALPIGRELAHRLLQRL